MIASMHRAFAPLAALALLASGACTQTSLAQESGAMSYHPQSIQPETTLNLSATGEVKTEPDIAYITTGVQTEAKTAQEAMAANREAMNGVFTALEGAGVAERDMQTSNFSVSPQYDYVREQQDGRETGRRVLRGYAVSNMVTAKVKDLDRLGETLDALVEAGSNTLHGINFGLEDDSETMNEARRKAVREATQRAALLAEAAGYSVARIVTMSEHSFRPGPAPMMEMARGAMMADAAPTPIAAGEVGYTAEVNITFELTR